MGTKMRTETGRGTGKLDGTELSRQRRQGGQAAGEGGKRSTIPPSNATSRIRRCRCRRTLRCATSAGGGSPRERAPWKRGTGGHEGEGETTLSGT